MANVVVLQEAAIRIVAGANVELACRVLENVDPKRGARAVQSPRDGLQKNQGWLELGAWCIRKLRQRQTIELYPWSSLSAIEFPPSKRPRVNRDPLALARFYQSLLDSKVVENRAALSRYLGVSRARVTQVLRRLDKPTETTPEGASE